MRLLTSNLLSFLLFFSFLWTSEVNTTSSDGPVGVAEAIERSVVVLVEVQIRAMSLSEVAVLEVLSSGMVSILLEDALESLLDRLNLPCILTSDISRTSFFFSLFPEPHKPATSPPRGRLLGTRIRTDRCGACRSPILLQVILRVCGGNIGAAVVRHGFILVERCLRELSPSRTSRIGRV